MILEHLRNNWDHHIAAGSGSVFSLMTTGLSVGGVIQAVVVGYTLWVLTTVTKWLVSKVVKK